MMIGVESQTGCVESLRSRTSIMAAFTSSVGNARNSPEEQRREAEAIDHRQGQITKLTVG